VSVKSKIRSAALCSAILVGTASPINAANHNLLRVEPNSKDNALVAQGKNLARIPGNTILDIGFAGLITASIYAYKRKQRRDIEQ